MRVFVAIQNCEHHSVTAKFAFSLALQCLLSVFYLLLQYKKLVDFYC